MVDSVWGRIINISGVLGKEGCLGRVVPYISRKHAISGFT